MLICPVCKNALEKKGRIWRCEGGHCYDEATQGYVNLLCCSQKHSKDPGDNSSMVQARRSFLAAGYYAQFSECLNGIVTDLLHQQIVPRQKPVVLDAGCGEGYYTLRLLAHLLQQEQNVHITGIDISKFAIKAAASAAKAGQAQVQQAQVQFAVASLFNLPLADQSADICINLFAPIVPAEFLRVLRPNGYLIIAVPGPAHLLGLKNILYSQPYQNEEKETVYPGFKFVARKESKGQITLTDNSMIQNLFSMTPYYWKTSVDGAARLAQTKRLTTQIHFDFLIYQAIAEHK